MMSDTSTSRERKQRDRPFPWTCGNCLKDEVYPEAMPYAIDVKHDGQSYHLEIPEIRIPKCRACGELFFSNSEDEEILRALRAQVRLLTPEQIRGAREALGLKSKEFAERLGVAAETISRWENGGLIQSRAMDNLLRVYFAVPEVREVLRGTEQDPALGTTAPVAAEPVNGGKIMNATASDVFTPEYAQRADQLFLRPVVQYPWDKIVNGVDVGREYGPPQQMWAVAPNTFRGYHRTRPLREDLPGAQETFQQYFTEQQNNFVRELRAVSDREELHQLSNRICSEIRCRLTNIRQDQLTSYNKLRKPVDLYLEHLAAMSFELEDVRAKLVPLLYLPLDRQMFQCCALFTEHELREHGLRRDEHDPERTSTYAKVTTEEEYRSLQQIVARRAGEVSRDVERPFWPIYFDILWGDRYRNWGSNLFETNPLKTPRCG